MERVDRLIIASERSYDYIDQVVDGETIARQQLRLGMNATAIALRHGKSSNIAGSILLRPSLIIPTQPGPLDTLANKYADVTRATVDRLGMPETDARHAIHLLQLAVTYAREHYPMLNSGRIALYALLHDLVEAYAKDVSSLGITPERKRQKDLDEAKAIKTLIKEYGADWPELIEVVENYEALIHPEARFVKTFDKIDPAFTHLHSKGSQLTGPLYSFTRETYFTAMDEATERMREYSGEFPLVMNDRDELTRRVATITFPKAT